jgi:hypothetical protein
MKIKQSPHTLLMIRPSAFAYNAETATSNAFQENGDEDPIEVLKSAQEEFDHMIKILEAHDVQVKVFDDIANPAKPDAVFPNNWISCHPDGYVFLYPLQAPNRRIERRLEIVECMKEQFAVKDIIDLSYHEEQGRFLEGTGSMVFDHPNKIAYACHSPRTHADIFHEVCKLIGYRPVLFHATDQKGNAVYHTNVVMSVGSRFAVICLDAIRSDDEQEVLLQTLADSGHKVVAISYEQMNNFAGNILEVQTRYGDAGVIMSQRAFNSLLPGQIDAITRFAEIITIPLDTIEKYGGGSVRCMVAGIHLPLLSA